MVYFRCSVGDVVRRLLGFAYFLSGVSDECDGGVSSEPAWGIFNDSKGNQDSETMFCVWGEFCGSRRQGINVYALLGWGVREVVIG